MRCCQDFSNFERNGIKHEWTCFAIQKYEIRITWEDCDAERFHSFSLIQSFESMSILFVAEWQVFKWLN